MIPRSCGKDRSSTAGFTMVELMVAMVVASVVLTGVFSFAAIQRGIASDHARQVQADKSLDGAMWAIGQDVNQAGLGFARNCTELRIWDKKRNRLLNPGAVQVADDMSRNARDVHTDEPFWVLRDGLQAHWFSASSTSLVSSAKVSSQYTSAADSFDVIRGDGNFVASTGLFEIDTSSLVNDSLKSGPNATLTLKSVASSEGSVALGRLDSSNAQDLAAAQQVFVPGSFVMVMAKGNEDSAFRASQQSQCALLQVTGNLSAGGDGESWTLPIGDVSSFNANLTDLLGLPSASHFYKRRALNGGSGGSRDFQPGGYDQAIVVPLGFLRWSRYEIDYSVDKEPFLVRSDIIGSRRDDATFASGSVAYPACPSNKCPAPQLRLPGHDDKIPRYAIAPMIEDMQVATGCDGYSKAAVDARAAQINDPHNTMIIPPPDPGFDELDKAPVANLKVDEAADFNGRTVDEWLGNAVGESWTPDCVFYGTAQTYHEKWATLWFGMGGSPALGLGVFRHSPQVMRVSLVARQTGKGIASPGGEDTLDKLPPLEDRAELNAFAPGFMTQTRTETFAPQNLRWRDPSMP